MQEEVTFSSDGLKLKGVLHLPEDNSGRPFAVIALLHGFGVSKDMNDYLTCADLLVSLGYACLRFDFRGCGESEGEPGHVICMEQVEDTKNAVSYLSQRPDIDAERIAVLGHSFGAAVAVYAGGVDKRIAAVISSCGWGDGERKFRKQHESPEAWQDFSNRLKEGREHFQRTGSSLMFNRWDIVPIPEHLRVNLTGKVHMEFPYVTVQSMVDFRANNVVADISPRPLLLLHAADDSVTPTEQSVELFQHAGQPADLVLLAGIDHFPLAESNSRARKILKDWLDHYMPA